jgi:hypothetical protein
MTVIPVLHAQPAHGVVAANDGGADDLEYEAGLTVRELATDDRLTGTSGGHPCPDASSAPVA